jgi:DNA-binding beta-propeller fold protein YncE
LCSRIDASTETVSAVSIDSGIVARILGPGQQLLSRPADIAIDPDSGKLFVVDCGTSPRLLTARLDGTGLQPLVERRLHWPTALAIGNNVCSRDAPDTVFAGYPANPRAGYRKSG